jgi:hypothetical protein
VRGEILRLEIIRKEFTERSTIGDLLIDCKFFSYTLEDCFREIKIPKETAIPYGVYEVITNHSNRFKKVMPLLLDVPGFDGVRIHILNQATESEGCIGLGLTKSKDFIGKSRDAFNLFFPLLKDALKKERVFLTITKNID